MNAYSLMRAWFNFAFENQGVVSGNHTGMFCWFIEQNNRMGWTANFAAPRDQTMAAVGITSHNTYNRVFNDLIEFGFVKMVKKSNNQWTANIIALSKNDITNESDLDSALSKNEQAQDCADAKNEQAQVSHCIEQESGTVGIIKPLNYKTIKPLKEKPLNTDPLLIATGDDKNFFNFSKTIFTNFYKEKSGAGEYYFRAVDGKKLKSILNQLFFKCKEKQKKDVFSEIEMIGAVTYFFTQAYETGNDWLKTNFNLSNIDSQFNNIYTAIHNGHNKNSKSKPAAATAEGVVGTLNEMFNPKKSGY